MSNLIKTNLKRRCPICNNDSGELLHNQKFILQNDCPLPNEYDLIICSRCDFIFADTSATQKNYDYYYSAMSKYEDESISTGSGNLLFDNNRLKKTAEDIVSNIRSLDANILDVGCASGGLLLELKKQGAHNLHGLDFSEKCINYLKSKGIQNGYVGSLSACNFKATGKLFDCIIMSHVLEHVYDVNGLINQIKNNLADDGIMYLEVPNAFQYHKFYTVPYHFFDIEHINHFDSNSLKNLALYNNFSIISEGIKEVNISETNLYPCCYIFLRKQSTEINFKNWQKNNRLKENITTYLCQCQSSTINVLIKNLIMKDIEIAIWGAGQYSMRLLRDTDLNKCRIAAFIDNDQNKQGKLLNGIEIKSSHFLKEFKGAIAIASAYNGNSIHNEIKKLNLPNEIILLN